MELGIKNNLTKYEPFIKDKRHSLFIGKPKTGKTTALTRLALDDIHAGESLVFLDSTGKAIDELLETIPKNRWKDVIYFNPTVSPFAFNILHGVEQENHALMTTTILETIKGVWGYDRSPTPNIDQYIRAGIGTLLSVKGMTLLSLKFLLTDEKFRAEILGQVQAPLLKDFWGDFEKLTAKEQRQDTASTLNKIRAFIFEPLVCNCIDQLKNSMSFKNKIVLVSLNDSSLGSENASLLGALLLSQLYVAGVKGLKTTLYVDSADRFGTAILGKILTGCPNMTAMLTLQYLDQLSKDFQPTLLGSVGQIIAFRTSVHDADILEPEFNLSNDSFHLFELKAQEAYVSIDGVSTELTMPQHTYSKTNLKDKILNRCISQYTLPKSKITERLRRFT